MLNLKICIPLKLNNSTLSFLAKKTLYIDI